MKTYDITFKTIANSLIHQWKTVLVASLIFAIVGGGFAVDLYRGGDNKYNSSIEEIPYLDKDCNIIELQDRYNLTVRYLSALENESTLTDKQKRAVLQKQETLQETKRFFKNSLNEHNLVIKEVNYLAKEIAEENYLSIAIEKENVYIAHGHKMNSAKEAALSLFLFCVLTGFCAGFFVALCREAKNKKFCVHKAS